MKAGRRSTPTTAGGASSGSCTTFCMRTRSACATRTSARTAEQLELGVELFDKELASTSTPRESTRTS